MNLHDDGEGIEPVHDRHLYIHRQEIRIILLDLLDGIPAVDGRTDDLEVRLRRKKI